MPGHPGRPGSWPRPDRGRRRSPWRLLAVPATLLAATALAGASGAALAATGAVARDAAAPAFVQSATATRTQVAPTGASTVVASSTVTVDVSQTDNLQGRQEIAVSWSGAHPTGGIVANQNSVQAQYEEYPVVLLQCRGTASQVTPETCWTQAATERYQSSYTADTPYQLDRYQATPGAAVVGQPATLPTTTTCKFTAVPPFAPPVRYWVPWVAADGQVYAGGTQGSCGQPPEASGGLTSALPSNETFGVTAADGTGSTAFDVFTTAVNATLGCSETVACSLVVVPITGISCDGALPGLAGPTGAAALAACEADGAYAAGAVATTLQFQNGADLTVTGSLWWSPSNWKNRIVAPLTFDPPRNVCTLVSGNNIVNVYGSELLSQATGQWAPSFCQGTATPFSFDHVATGEPQARNLVASGAADAAFTSYAQPGGYGKPVVSAPVAVTGFTVAFAVDDTAGRPVATLKLTPLLLAKLLTESYPDLTTTQGADPALAGNPLNITDDPEFIALNPSVPQLNGGHAAASELISISSDSDVIEALTTYIDGTPAARAFLDGVPDTTDGEHMVVNPAYKGIQLPVDQWPLLSTYTSTIFDHGVQRSYCLGDTPQPLYSLIAAPLANLSAVSLAMQFQNANSTVICTPNLPGAANSMVASGRQAPGQYFMLGITPLADDDRYNLQAAALQTTPGTFVAPDDSSLRAATSLLVADPGTGTWPVPYGAFQTSAGAQAYPGTMVVYAAVPTTGLGAEDAADLATLLRFAASTGQSPGSGVGQLPPGYLPLTEANGLGALADYTRAAADDVAAQNGQVPSMSPAPATTTSGSTATAAEPAGPSSGTEEAASPAASAGTLPSFGGVSSLTFPSGRALLAGPLLAAVGAKAAAHGAGTHHHAHQAAPRPIWLGHTLDVALWTGGLGRGGALVAVVLGVALLIVVLVPPLYLAGRKRGRW
ncbi:MAG TPA: hypothetical protein VHB02_04630 [Acidimicrobiales bacterium]|nr:hypothetical protein [Acidimicrobiales bacterium]